MRRVRYLVALAGFYAGEAGAFAAGVGLLTLLAATGVFLLAAGAVVILVGFLREELVDLGSRLRAGTGAR